MKQTQTQTETQASDVRIFERSIVSRRSKAFYDSLGMNVPKQQSLHKKQDFELGISSVNVTKTAGNCGFGHIY